jgi:hypothetical protein
MPRNLSPRAILEAQRLNSDAVFLVLLTVFLEGFRGEQDLRVVNNTEDITSKGRVFVACPFRITLPEDVDEVITSPASLEIDNVDPRIWQSVRMLPFAPRVSIEVILAEEPDTIVLSTVGLKLREATASTTTVSGSLVPDSIWQTGYPVADFDPQQNPGLFT